MLASEFVVDCCLCCLCLLLKAPLAWHTLHSPLTFTFGADTMVCLNLEFTNNTSFIWSIEPVNGSWKSFDGNFTIARNARGHIMKLRPESGFMGVECGIQGTFNLVSKANPGLIICYNVDFPAAGADTFNGNSMADDVVQTSQRDNGKYGTDNPHNLIVQIAYSGKMSQVLQHKSEDDTANFLRDQSVQALKLAAAAATG
jgi:hypothetical protein